MYLFIQNNTETFDLFKVLKVFNGTSPTVAFHMSNFERKSLNHESSKHCKYM